MLMAEEVECNDGLLISILVCLLPKAVFKFRCVSKRWKNIIADPFFRESYSARTRKGQLFAGGGRLLIQERECSRGSCLHHHINILPTGEMGDHEFKQIPGRFGTSYLPRMA